MSNNAYAILDALYDSDKTDRGRLAKEEILEAYNSYLEDPSKRMKKMTLTSAFFRTVMHILKKRIPKDESYTLNLTKTELQAIDFGYIFPDLIDCTIEETQKFLGEINWNTGTSEYLKFFSITGYINHEFHKIMGYFDLLGMNKEIQKLEHEYESLQNEKKQYLTDIIGQINEVYSVDTLFNFKNSILTMNTNIYRLTEALLTLKKRVQTGQALSAAERKNLIGIENKQKQIQRERNNLYKEHKIEHKTYLELNSLEDKYFKKIDECQDKFHKIEKAKKDMAAFKDIKSGMPLVEKEEFITEKVTEIQNLIDYASKRSKVVSFPLLTKKIPNDLPEQILKTFKDSEKFDQRLFKNKNVRIHGMPGVILGPGAGEGFFNYENSKFYIPLNYADKLEDSVIQGIVVYKWDMDETRELRDSFADIKKYKGKSFVELQKGLFKEYHTYTTKECRGYKVMEKEIKEWFTWQVAPTKEELQTYEENEGNEKNSLESDDNLQVKTVERIVDEADALPPVEENTPETKFEIKTSADECLSEFYTRIQKILKWPDLTERIQFNKSEVNGDVDLVIKNIDVSDTESELLFHALLIQAKMKRLRGLERENWDKSI